MSQVQQHILAARLTLLSTGDWLTAGFCRFWSARYHEHQGAEMMFMYVPPNSFKQPDCVLPSPDYHGENSIAPIHQAVGRALSSWEHAESAWAKAFQLFCEARSLAAVRAFGTIESVASKNYALRYAALEFFSTRETSDAALTKTLLGIHLKASEFRNQIAHGMALQPQAYGYFLCPASYATKQRKTRPAYPTEAWGLGADYFYRGLEIDLFGDHFDDILSAVMSLVMYLNEKYSVIELGEFHP